MRTTLAAIASIVLLSIVPTSVRADGGVITGAAISAAPSIFNLLTNGITTKADAMCTGDPADKWPTDANKNGVIGVIGKPCSDVTSGFKTTGACTTVLKCKAVSTSDGTGIGLDKVVGMLGQLAGQLLKGGSGSGSGSSGATTATTATGCTTSTYITNVVSSDPCAVYVPAAITTTSTSADNSNVTSALLDALNGTSGSNTSDISSTASGSSATDILNQYSSTTTQATVIGKSSSTTLNSAGNVFGQSANLLPGLSGDISVLNNGATFVVNNRDQGTNTEVAGFYGSDTTLGSQPTGLVASWCQSRPWSTNFLSAIISPSFFDSLCKLRGYAVGTSASTAPTQTQVSITQSPVRPVKTVATSTISVVPLTVDIWASPATVSLGARTSVFWTSAGASSCTVTSPDGSFSQHTLTGGASTVAITSATVFTISCTAADGSHATKNVTVQIAI